VTAEKSQSNQQIRKPMQITSSTAAKNMAEEAKETPVQTKAEAAKGDQQAVRKLAQEVRANPPEAPQSVIDSSRGRLDAKA
jgi:hypothetical protein